MCNTQRPSPAPNAPNKLSKQRPSCTVQNDLVNATCTNCGHELKADEIETQAKSLPATAIQKMIADAKALRR